MSSKPAPLALYIWRSALISLHLERAATSGSGASAVLRLLLVPPAGVLALLFRLELLLLLELLLFVVLTQHFQ